MLTPTVKTASVKGHDAHMPETQEAVLVPRSELIAVSRLLWDIGSEESTTDPHRMDCFRCGERPDHLAGVPPHTTPGQPISEIIAFYERVRDHVDGIIGDLQEWDQP